MDLKNIVRQRIINDVFRSVKTGEWKVLVVDQLGLRIISSCCKMSEIVDERVTLVEDLLKKREPLPHMEAIYFITPNDNSICLLIQDFLDTQRALYRSAHIFFAYACPKELFNELCKSKCAKYIKTLKEVNIAFLPYESQVFSLDVSKALQLHYNPAKQTSQFTNLERIAEQISTVCVTLGEHPKIGYQIGFNRSIKLAQLVQQKLEAYKADEPTMGEGPEKLRSKLIILDRGFDCVSPLLHELTFQAMAYDLLPIENDVYREMTIDGEKDAFLDETDEIWCELKHQHIADVLPIVSENIKEFSDSKRKKPADNASLKHYSQFIKTMPENRKKHAKQLLHFHLAEDCMKAYNEYVNKICKVEQDLAMGTDGEREKVKDPMFTMVPILLGQSVGMFDKIRIILLYILSKNGISEENLTKLIERAQIPSNNKCIITNMAHLGLTIIGGKKKIYQAPRKPRVFEKAYLTSRWTPVLKDIVEDAVDDKLDEKHFEFLGRRVTSPRRPIPMSVRYGHWHKDKHALNVKNVPRIIVFVIGGMTYSEMRCCYEVAKDVKNWEILIGSDHILTPDTFLKELRDLSC